MNEGMIEWGRDITYGTNVLPGQVIGVRAVTERIRARIDHSELSSRLGTG